MLRAASVTVACLSSASVLVSYSIAAGAPGWQTVHPLAPPNVSEQCVLQVPILCGSTYLVLRAFFCISANLTTNELLTRDRYTHMHRPDGTFWNPYDRGVLANCHMFWCRNSLPDWGVVLREERQVKLRMPSRVWLYEQPLRGRMCLPHFNVWHQTCTKGALI